MFGMYNITECLTNDVTFLNVKVMQMLRLESVLKCASLTVRNHYNF